ncbi:hypothetical protein WJX79_004827 [Trebouxia sp. C0005]
MQGKNPHCHQIRGRFLGDKHSIRQLQDHLKGQTEQYVLGYILKDQKQTHCEVSHSNIPDDVMHDAHKAYQIVHTDFTENSRLITNSNLWKVLYQIWNRHLKPLDPNPERILHWMMQTGEYMPEA